VVKAGNKALEDGIDVLAPGCSLALETPTENIRALRMVSLPRSFHTGSRRVEKAIDVFTRYDLYRREEKVKRREVGDVLEEVREAVVAGDSRKVIDLVKKALEIYDPIEVINRGLVEGINIVGELWNSGEYFLPQVILSADAMQVGIKICEETMGRPIEKKGRIK